MLFLVFVPLNKWVSNDMDDFTINQSWVMFVANLKNKYV